MPPDASLISDKQDLSVYTQPTKCNMNNGKCNHV